MTLAVQEEMIDANPVVGLARPLALVSRERMLDDAGLKLFWGIALEGEQPPPGYLNVGLAARPEPVMALAIQFLMLTLSRRNEAVGARKAEFDLDAGLLEKVGVGLYMAPRRTRFGKAPASADKLVAAFLKDDRFLVVSPNAFNGLSVGATQMHNVPVVYNLKRHGRFSLGGRTFDFRKKTSVPTRLTEEVLMVDLLQSPDRLPEDRTPSCHVP